LLLKQLAQLFVVTFGVAAMATGPAVFPEPKEKKENELNLINFILKR